MKNKNLLIITNYMNLIPQRIKDKEGIDIYLIKEFLEKKGICVRTINYNELNSNLTIAKDYNFIYYASSQIDSYKSFILDHLMKFNLDLKVLIPGIEHFHAHENKVFQTIYLNSKNINYIKSRVISNYEEGQEYLKNSKYPLIVKTSRGYGSKGVRIIKNYFFGLFYLRKYLNNKYHNTKGLGKVIFQEFIPELEGDWKILVFGDKISGLYRKVRTNDFRASGSGKFEFKEIPKKILEFVSEIKNELNVPWASFDILEKDEKLYLGEYQIIHFGLTTALKCPFHYKKEKNKNYKIIKGPINIDFEIANEILKIINNENNK